MERDYAELIKALRFAFDQPCYSCVLGEKCNWGDFCFFKRAADAIEELIKTSRRWELEAAANEKDKQYLVDENRRLVDSLMNLLVQKWISVEERLPGDCEHVLCRIEEECMYYDATGGEVFAMDSYLCEAHYSRGKHKGWYKAVSPDISSCTNNVTHWMPLPEPPKEGKP